jgi:hypothetical protein
VANSAVELFLRALPGAPIITVNSAGTLIGRSYRATNEAVDRLVEAWVLAAPIRAGKRNRAFEAREIIDAFTDLDRQLASTVGNTVPAPRARRVPSRPSKRTR